MFTDVSEVLTASVFRQTVMACTSHIFLPLLFLSTVSPVLKVNTFCVNNSRSIAFMYQTFCVYIQNWIYTLPVCAVEKKYLLDIIQSISKCVSSNCVYVYFFEFILYYRVGHKSLDKYLRFKCIFVKRLMAHPVL
jgi:hypothetical protein